MTAPRLLDRVKETVTTEGTGSYSVSAAVAIGYRGVATAFANGDTGIFAVEDGIGGYEVFVGTYTAPTTLARTTILRSSNSNLAVDWGAGNKTLACVITAEYADLVRMKHQLAGGAAPTVNDDAVDGYRVGSIWIYGAQIYVCTTETAAAAVWQRVSTTGAGTNTVLIGPSSTAAGNESVSIGNNTSAAGAAAVAIGDANAASAAGSVAIGDGVIASDTNAVAIGTSAQASQEAAIAIGFDVLCNADFAVAIGHESNIGSTAAVNAVAIGKAATVSYPNGVAIGGDSPWAQRNSAAFCGMNTAWKWTLGHGAISGDATIYADNYQTTMFKLTTNATPAKLELGGDATTHGYNDVPEGACLLVEGQVTAISSANAKAVLVQFSMRRLAAGNVTIIGTPTVTTVGEDAGAAAWAVAVSADTTNQAFQIDVTGAAATDIAWAGVFRCTMVEYYP